MVDGWVHLLLGFFFSSRRRHTRWPRDWSSDVCSSDLYTVTVCVAEYRNSAPSPLLHCWADLSMKEGGETVISLEAIPLSLRNALILLVFSSMDLYNV